MKPQHQLSCLFSCRWRRGRRVYAVRLLVAVVAPVVLGRDIRAINCSIAWLIDCRLLGRACRRALPANRDEAHQRIAAPGFGRRSAYSDACTVATGPSAPAWPARSWCRPSRPKNVRPHAFSLLRHLVRQHADRLRRFLRHSGQHAHARQGGRRQVQIAARARALPSAVSSAACLGGRYITVNFVRSATCWAVISKAAQVWRQEHNPAAQASSSAWSMAQFIVVFDVRWRPLVPVWRTTGRAVPRIALARFRYGLRTGTSP